MSDARTQHAFPSGDGEYSGGPNHDYGMSLRDWFAGQALAECVRTAIAIETAGYELKDDGPVAAAKMAYQVADAMLKEREK